MEPYRSQGILIYPNLVRNVQIHSEFEPTVIVLSESCAI
jgi:hypothetical protein